MSGASLGVGTVAVGLFLLSKGEGVGRPGESASKASLSLLLVGLVAGLGTDLGLGSTKGFAWVLGSEAGGLAVVRELDRVFMAEMVMAMAKTRVGTKFKLAESGFVR